MLEASLHTSNAFVTLTYSDEHLPTGGTLEPRHLQLWLKKIRKELQPIRLRFFGVGEYGDNSLRPHYHVALFGYPSCLRGRTDHRRHNCCENCDRIQKHWIYGGVDLGQLEPESAAYISGYVTKKMTSHNDERLDGRHPEFARMSNRPGIGADFMHEVASTLLQYNLENEDVPFALAHGKRVLPLGRYLRTKLSQYIGKDSEEHKISGIKKAQENLRPLWEASRSATPGFKEFAFKQAIIEKETGKHIQQVARFKRFKRKETL